MTFLLILTTALHYAAIIPIYYSFKETFNRIYINTILYSTTVSVVWYFFQQSTTLLYFEYFLATLWFLEDILWSKLLEKKRIVYLNFIVFLLNALKSEVEYDFVWKCNLLSVIKCVYVSYLINTYDKKDKNNYNLGL